MNVRQSLQYFGVQKPWDVAWVHRVNSYERWEEFVKNSRVTIVEGDIRLRDNDIVMQHEESDSFTMKYTQWLDMIVHGNVSLKLDFKEQEIVVPCLKILKNLEIKNCPVILNADIISGPGGNKSVFDAQVFISSCKEYFPDALLSIGWETEHGNKEGFTSKMVEQALSLSSLWNGDVLFAVELSYIKDFWEVLKLLVEKDNNFISLWNMGDYWTEDCVKSELIEFVKNTLDHYKVFQDFIDEMEIPTRL